MVFQATFSLKNFRVQFFMDEILRSKFPSCVPDCGEEGGEERNWAQFLMKSPVLEKGVLSKRTNLIWDYVFINYLKVLRSKRK